MGVPADITVADLAAEVGLRTHSHSRLKWCNQCGTVGARTSAMPVSRTPTKTIATITRLRSLPLGFGAVRCLVMARPHAVSLRRRASRCPAVRRAAQPFCWLCGQNHLVSRSLYGDNLEAVHDAPSGPNLGDQTGARCSAGCSLLPRFCLLHWRVSFSFARRCFNKRSLAWESGKAGVGERMRIA